MVSEADPATIPRSRRGHHAALTGFAAASDIVGEVSSVVSIGSTAVALEVAGSTVADLILPAFAWRAAVEPAARQPAATLFAYDSMSGAPRPASPWRVGDFLVRDEVVGSGDDDVSVAYGLESRLLSTFDATTHQGVWWTPDAGGLPSWELTAPLRYQLHWSLGQQQLAFVHAAVVGKDGKGILLVGRGGAGKSTATAACLDNGWEFLADDYCVLECSPVPRAHSVYRYAKLAEPSLAMVPGLRDAVAWQRPADAKHVLDIAGRRPEQMVRTCELVAVVLPEITSSHELPVEVHGARRARDLVASTMFQMASPSTASLGVVADVIESLPAYRVGLNDTAHAIVAALDRVLDEVAG